LATTAIALVVAGCAVREAERHVQSTAAAVEPLTAAPARPSPPVRRAVPHILDEAYFPATVTHARNGVPLPPAFLGPRAIHIEIPLNSALRDITAAITLATGLSVDVSDETLSGSTADVNRQPTMAPSPMPGLPSDDLPQNSPLLAQLVGASTGRQTEPTMGITHHGDLPSLLDRIAGRFGMRWEYTGHILKLYRYVTKTWQIETFATATNADASFSGAPRNSRPGSAGASGGGGADSGGTKTAASTKLDPWGELIAGVTALLPQNDHIISPMPTTGMLTVRAPVDAMDAIDRHIRTVNQELARMLRVTVEFITVDFSENDDYAASLDLLLADAGIRLATNSPIPVASTAAGSIAATLVAPTGSRLKAWGGSSVVAQALSSRYNAATVKRIPLLAKNNQLVPFRETEFFTYVPSISLPVQAAGTAGYVVPPMVTTAVVEAGTEVQVQPRVLDDGVIELQVAIKISELPTRTDFEPAPGQKVQLLSGSEFVVPLNTFRMQANSTLVLGSFAHDSQKADRAGVGAADFPGLGGRIVGGTSRRRLIITVTPEQLDPKMRPIADLTGTEPPPPPAASLLPPPPPPPGAP
jgi:type IVB pilus formation R64 PilN family outer membrane protein